jgi:type II secretory pathway pseudopilin PulG
MVVMKGQMLIEIILSTMVIALVLVGVLDLVTRSSSSVQQQKSRQIASRLVEQKLTEYRLLRSEDKNNFRDNVVNPKDVYRACSWDNVDYKCEVLFADLTDGGGVLVTVRAVWSDKEVDDRNVSLSTVIDFQI